MDTSLAPTGPAPLSSTQTTESGVQRLSELDALRGIAALSVVFWHFFCGTYTSLPAAKTIYWVSRAEGAVLLFFILSGFVLSLPFERKPSPTYLAFAIRRVCRIYLPYLAGIALSILVITCVATSKIPQLSPWFNMTSGVPFNGRIAVEHLFLIGNIHSNTYNNAIWSLIQEMRVSLVFPLLFWVVSRNKVATNLAFCAALSGFSVMAMRLNLETSNGHQTGYSFTPHIASLFIIGILLARYRHDLVTWYRQIPAAVKWLVLLFALALYRASMELPAPFLRDYGCACAAVVFIVSALGSRRLSAILRGPVFTFLGNVSYAVYLNHLTVLFFVLSMGFPALSFWSLGLAFVALTLLISLPFWRYVERPCISLGRVLVRRFFAHPSMGSQAS